MSKEKIHKNAKDQTPCGIPCWKNAKRANEWKYVTCKNCLKKRPPFKLSDHQKAFATAVEEEDNLKSINEELNDLLWSSSSPAPSLKKEDFKSIYSQITEAGSGLTKEHILVPPSAEALETVFDAKEQPKTPFEKWEQWFVLCCDHSISPQPHEVWDGAIDTICMYLINEMCSELGLDETNRILNKAKKKFKT